MSRILDYAAQLSAVPANERSEVFVARSRRDPIRTDEVHPSGSRLSREFAPDFKEGFFVVPKLGQFE